MLITGKYRAALREALMKKEKDIFENEIEKMVENKIKGLVEKEKGKIHIQRYR